ncbi:MAG: DnaJ family domain-containing protein [Planctomycetota bacterium]
MDLRNVDLGAALRRIADRRIEQAMDEGKFNNLEGEGKPLDLEPVPADEEAKAMYWAVKLCRQNNVLGDAMKKEALRRTTSE